MNHDNLTRKQIEAMQTEAGTAGDYDMVDICERALDGCPIALAAVAKAINDIAAMDDETLARATTTYWLAYAREDGEWDIVRGFEARSDAEANAYAEANHDGEWYVLDSTRRNINGGAA